ncbi:multicopper oxidase family protein [Falsiroseomonas bella]|uniref:multicopper oxidase family protein n=1 Tax=Falsiroseomonas bella TaxID=2184016 RepID=UPI001E56E6BA|nr:multicopper oxidase family protein [Falsiroseomonas bella]
MLRSGLALGLAAGAPLHARAAQPALRVLRAVPAQVPLLGGAYPETAVWGFDGQVPGPELRVRQGDMLRVELRNGLPEPTTIHWHGLRVPHAMDGVPHLTQPPIAPGASFTYAFRCEDAGTFWYHPHANSPEQLGRGLSGALIVEEAEDAAPPVDRDVTWLLSDFRVGPDAAIRADFGEVRDIAHAGRLGNAVTINGRVPQGGFAVWAGERIRLRLINAANARIFALAFEDHAPLVIALDGHPVAPHAPEGGRVLLGPGMRADLILDMTGAPGERFAINDSFFPRGGYRLTELAYAEAPPLRATPQPAPAMLPPNPLAEPVLDAQALRVEIAFGGGMMGGLAEATLDGERLGMRELLRRGMAWAVNGVVMAGHAHKPLFTLARGQSCIVTLRNATAWWHPIHLHGHAFRVLARNGAPTAHREWRDTLLMAPREEVRIAFVGDNPGDWMLHCHVLEHHVGGMGGVFRVA